MLQIDVRILSHPVRLSAPCLVEVSVINNSEYPLLLNKRLSVGYKASLARELFVEVFKQGSEEPVSQQGLLYQRGFSPPSDYVLLKPGQSISKVFDLFEWYSLPAPGKYELIAYYQADETLAEKPSDLLTGTYSSNRIALEVEP